MREAQQSSALFVAAQCTIDCMWTCPYILALVHLCSSGQTRLVILATGVWFLRRQREDSIMLLCIDPSHRLTWIRRTWTYMRCWLRAPDLDWTPGNRSSVAIIGTRAHLGVTVNNCRSIARAASRIISIGDWAQNQWKYWEVDEIRIASIRSTYETSMN